MLLNQSIDQVFINTHVTPILLMHLSM